jgi:hypothetical protein
MISSTRITGIFLAILLGLTALAVLVGAAGAKDEKVCVKHDGEVIQVGSQKAADAHVRNHEGDQIVDCATGEPPPPPNPLLGLVATLADPNVDGSINVLSFPQLAGAQCTIEADATITVAGVEGTALAGREFILRNGATTSFLVFSDFGLVVEGILRRSAAKVVRST